MEVSTITIIIIIISMWRIHLTVGDICCSLKVQGVLPSLVVPISDKRLQDILVLVKSIPFPESDPAPEEDNVCNLFQSLHLLFSM